jgi:hypothetical protein
MSIRNPDLSPANAGLFIQQKLLKPPSTDPGTVRRTGRSNSRLLARTIRRDLVRPVEQLRISYRKKIKTVTVAVGYPIRRSLLPPPLGLSRMHAAIRKRANPPCTSKRLNFSAVTQCCRRC